MPGSRSPYFADRAGNRRVRAARLRPLLAFAGIGLLTAWMMITGGSDVALFGLFCFAVVFGGGGLWIQRVEDHQDFILQARVDGQAILATQAICAGRPSGWPTVAGVQRGELRVTREGVSWTPGPTSTAEPLRIPRESVEAVSVSSRGLFWRRGSLIVSTPAGEALFVTSARVARLLAGLEQLKLPAPS